MNDVCLIVFGGVVGVESPDGKPLVEIVLNEELKTDAATNATVKELIILEMNYSQGTWRKLKRRRKVVQ